MKIITKIFFIVFLLASVREVSSQPITWQRVYGGPQPEYGKYGIQTFDGGYIIVALKQGVGGGTLLLKIDQFGIEEWSKIIDTAGTGVCILQTIDSGYIISGGSSGLAMLIRTDRMGNLLWKKLYTINNEGSSFRKVRITKRGDFIMCGVISFPPKAFVVKSDSNGNIIDLLAFSNSSFSANAYDFCESSDDFIYLTGLTVVNNKAKTLIAKISYNLKLIWSSNYGSEGEGDAQSSISILTESDTILYLTGAYSDFYSTEAHFTKIDSSGNLIFQNVLPQTNFSNSMCLTSSGNFAIVGGLATTSDDILFLLINNSGGVISRKTFNTSGFEGDFSESILKAKDKGFIITGYTSFLNTSDQDYNIYIIKTDSVGNALVSIRNLTNEIPASLNLFQSYPNPFNSSTIIKFDLNKSGYILLSIYDITGKKIKTIVNGYFKQGSYEVKFDGTNLSSGIYFYNLTYDNYSVTKKMLQIK